MITFRTSTDRIRTTVDAMRRI